MSDHEWNDPEQRCLGVGLGGTASAPELVLLLNPTEAECEFHMPASASGGWSVVLDTAHPVGVLSGFEVPTGPLKVGPYQTLALLRVL
jgi:hypothetical protein